MVQFLNIKPGEKSLFTPGWLIKTSEEWELICLEHERKLTSQKSVSLGKSISFYKRRHNQHHYQQLQGFQQLQYPERRQF